MTKYPKQRGALFWDGGPKIFLPWPYLLLGFHKPTLMSVAKKRIQLNLTGRFRQNLIEPTEIKCSKKLNPLMATFLLRTEKFSFDVYFIFNVNFGEHKPSRLKKDARIVTSDSFIWGVCEFGSNLFSELCYSKDIKIRMFLANTAS